MFKILKNRKGVTLVELLAVVVILGIIAAIAVPTIGGLIARQQANADKATYNAIVDAAELYGGTAVFTLDKLEQDDFIDLKANTFSLNGTDNVLKTAVYIKIVGGVVRFYSDAAGTTATDFYVNDTLVYEKP
ncbi:MAG: prepilin-type N-terminal cleavage/methylation domain-containing protein [Acholeplasmataceae bacterium]|nr:prepilin-type N-terminal cleavage/methylation domain-containing protein [Acholeplasmataceae bacterium]